MIWYLPQCCFSMLSTYAITFNSVDMTLRVTKIYFMNDKYMLALLVLSAGQMT